MAESKLTKLPTDFKCPQCQTPIPAAMSMIGHEKARVAKGMIMICSACGGINVLGDSQLHPMTRAEFNALPAPSQRTVIMTRAGIVSKLQSGGSWTPYGGN